jgi:hypothetical protein
MLPGGEALKTIDQGVACCGDTNSSQCSRVAHGVLRPCYDIPIRGDIDASMQACSCVFAEERWASAEEQWIRVCCCGCSLRGCDAGGKDAKRENESVQLGGYILQ